MIKIILWVVLSLPGQQPVTHQEEMRDLGECTATMTEMLDDAYGALSERTTSGSMVQVACVLIKEDQPT